MAVLRDLAEVTHWLSIVRITPEAAEDPTVPPDERARGLDLAERLSMRVLTRMWQMLLKALEEVSRAPNAMMAAEMTVIRLTHVADLPSPEDLVRRLQSLPPPGPGSPGNGPGIGRGNRAGAERPLPQTAQAGPRTVATPSGGGVAMALSSAPETSLARYASFPQVVELIRANRDVKLLIEVETTLRLVHYAPGRIEFQPTPEAPPDLAARLSGRLQGWTGVRWGVSVVSEGGGRTIAEERDAEQEVLRLEARNNPLVQAVLEAFPGARVAEVRTAETATAEAAEAALPEVPDEWDPFEDE